MKPFVEDSANGYSVLFTRSDDGKTMVARRFDTRKEVDDYLEEINKPGSGWFPEELESLSIVPDKNWILKI